MPEVLSVLRNYDPAGLSVKVSYRSFEAKGRIVRQLGIAPPKERIGKRRGIFTIDAGQEEAQVELAEGMRRMVTTALWKVELDDPVSIEDYMRQVGTPEGRESALIQNLSSQSCFDEASGYLVCVIIPHMPRYFEGGKGVELTGIKKGQPIEYTMHDSKVDSNLVFAGFVVGARKAKNPSYGDDSLIVPIFLIEGVPARQLYGVIDKDEIMPGYVSETTRYIGDPTYRAWEDFFPATLPPSIAYDERYRIHKLDKPIPLASVKDVCEKILKKEVLDGVIEKEELDDQLSGCLVEAMEFQIIPIDVAHKENEAALRPMRLETAFFYAHGYPGIEGTVFDVEI